MSEMELKEKTVEITDPRYSSDLYYKYLNADGSAIYGNGYWPLPQNGTPGSWLGPVQGELVPCENGLHACREKDLLGWGGEALYVVEFEEEPTPSEDKVVGRKARLLYRLENCNEKNQRLFAADCAERTLHICERFAPEDRRPRNAVEAARQYAHGEIGKEGLAAARYAAWAAARASASWASARASARDAAWASARASASWDAARASARDAAWASASWASARASARDAAWDGERSWQRQRFLEYVWGGVR